MSKTIDCLTVAQPKYWCRLRITSPFAIPPSTATAARYDTLDPNGGMTSNWTITLPTNILTIPVSGLYLVHANTIFIAGNTATRRESWLEINGSGRRYAYAFQYSTISTAIPLECTTIFQFNAGDTIQVIVFQNTSFSINLGPISQQYPELQITRLF